MIDTLIERPLCASLYEIGMNSDDPARLAKFYETAFGYLFTETAGGLQGTALERRLQIRKGSSKTLAYAAYRVTDTEDLAALERRLDRAKVAFERINHEGFAFPSIAFADPDGNRLVFGLAEKSADAVEGATAQRPARIQHVVFATTDIHRMLSFFIDVLGFTLSDSVVDDEGALRTAFVRCSHEHHSLAVFAASENALDHYCYETGNWNLIRDWADHFARYRVQIKWGPGRHGPGNNLFLFILDPDGNWVEISAELEQVGPDRPAGKWQHEERTLNSWGIGLLRS
jgi:catechol 2,3-dioxygenase